mgnify:CR=1 FL=1
MNKTILIIAGIACAVITAAGIMWYNGQVNALRKLGVSEEEIEQAKNRNEGIINFTGKVKNTSIYIWNDYLFMIDIKEVDKPDGEIQPGREFGYCVYFPSQLLHEPEYKAVGKEYKFRIIRGRNKKGELDYSDLMVMDEILRCRPLLHDKDASVRRKAIDFLSSNDGRDKESIPEIKKLLIDENEQVRQAVANALESLDRWKK